MRALSSIDPLAERLDVRRHLGAELHHGRRKHGASPAACFSTLFTATNRIVGRDAASAIASASAASSEG